MNFVLIPNIRIHAANMMASNLCLSAAQPMALFQFAHAMGRKTSARVKRVAILHHDAQPLGENDSARFLPHQRRGASFIDDKDYVNGTASLALQPTASMHLEVSLLIEFDRTPEYLDDALQGVKIAGGTVAGFGEVSHVDSLEKLPALNGSWLVDRRDLMDAKRPFERFIEIFADGAESRPSWLAAAVVGYAMTTEFEARGGVRQLDDGTEPLHAFCEPLVGVVQYVSVRTAKEQGVTTVPFWQATWIQDDVFLLTGDALDVDTEEEVAEDDLQEIEEFEID